MMDNVRAEADVKAAVRNVKALENLFSQSASYDEWWVVQYVRTNFTAN